jgi:hypothetical protein
VPPAPRDSLGAPVSFAVSCERRQGPILYTSTAVDWQSLHVTGRTALTENCLVKVTLHLASDLGIWMNVIGCAAREGGEYDIELRPFALHGEVKTAYHAMVGAAVRGVVPKAAGVAA